MLQRHRCSATLLGILATSVTVIGAREPRTFEFAYVASSFYPSGMPAQWGQDSLDAVRLAVEDANEGGWCGPACRLSLPSALVHQANGTDSPALVHFVQTSVAVGTTAILGADWGRVAAAVLTALGTSAGNATAPPLISAGVTAPAFDTQTFKAGFLRTCYSDSQALPALLQNLVFRATSATATSPKQLAVLYTEEIYGLSALQFVQDIAVYGGPAVVAKAGFDSGADREAVRQAVRHLLAGMMATATGQTVAQLLPMVLVCGPGPDTTTALLALADEAVSGPPTGNWIIGALEASASVVHTVAEDEAAAGYNSYLTSMEGGWAGKCAARDSFEHRFRERFGRSPGGGFAIYSYDSVVLLAAALRVRQQQSSDRGGSLVDVVRDAAFGVQGLSGPLVFQDGQSSPCTTSVSITQLLEGYDPKAHYRETRVAEYGNATALCPMAAQVGAPIAPRRGRRCLPPRMWPPQPPLVQFCTPAAQNANACGQQPRGGLAPAAPPDTLSKRPSPLVQV